MLVAVGGRLGIVPIDQIEIGGSIATLFNNDNNIDVLLAGADLSMKVAGLSAKSEYIYQSIAMAGNDPISKQGFYAQTMYEFEPVYLISRYSSVFQNGKDTLKILSVGFGLTVIENAEIRFEYSNDINTGGNVAFIQLAGGMGWAPTGLRR